MRKSGILCHISSLPSPYGIGSFGKAAYDFVDFLVESKQSYWQILPIGPTSYGDSPYQTFSVFANNPYFIDLDILIEEKLLKHHEIKATFKTPQYVEYKELYEERFDVLRIAFGRFDASSKDYQTFLDHQQHWLPDYALFSAIKNAFDGKSWLYWEKGIRLRAHDAMRNYREKLKDEIAFFEFLQYKSYEQWMKLKSYANKKDVQIIGDMPIYVSYDSSDVWANPNLFELNEKREPIHIAGVPPDNYSKDGQLWGNPLYDWKVMEETNFAWWIERVKASIHLFDWIRIDHFIGFQNFFSVDYGQKTAHGGVWRKGPGMKLFNVIKEKLGSVNIIAEDLGVVTEEVRKLLRLTGFPGMKLLQFAFDSREENDYIPHLYSTNTVVYTGTHDNETTKTWFTKLLKKDLDYCLEYINHKGKGSKVESLIKATLQSVSETAVIPLQDYLELGDEGRMNIPSTVGNNWKWRALESDFTKQLSKRIAHLTTLYGRANGKDI